MKLDRLKRNVPFAIIERAVKCSDHVIDLCWFLAQLYSGLTHFFKQWQLANDEHARVRRMAREPVTHYAS